MEDKKTNSFLFNLYHKYVKPSKQEEENEPVNPPASAVGSEKSAPISDGIEPVKEYLTPLYRYYLLLTGKDIANIRDSELRDFEQRLFSPIRSLDSYDRYESTADSLIREISSQADDLEAALLLQEQMTSGEEEPAPIVVEPAIHIKLTPDHMAALIIVIPPYHEGAGPTVAAVSSALKAAGVTYGVESDTIQSIVDQTCYMQICLAAEGLPPIDGTDGRLSSVADTDSEAELLEDNRGNVDFKNLNMIRNIAKDEVICEIIPPIDGIPGEDVTGKVLPAKNGKAVPSPAGKNTYFSEDGSKLLAKTDGQLVFRDKKFIVEPVYVVQKNVDYSIGNIDFLGNVIINGDIINGFTVKAGGDVTVHGMIEGATVIAGGNVTINRGMNGNFNGMIEAKGDVKASFLENCTVYTGGCLYANSVVMCNIFCEDTAHIDGTKGVIIGGNIMAYRAVEARIIGSKSRRETKITLGEMPRLVEKKNALTAELKETDNMLRKLNLNINYLLTLKNGLPPEKQEVLTQIQEQHTLYIQKKEELRQSLEELENQGKDFSDCYVKSNMIFPPTRVTIGSDYYLVDTLSSRCKIYQDEDGVAMTTY